jgi:response regulator RpfG family c-di-GMP phosphodiesterase
MANGGMAGEQPRNILVVEDDAAVRTLITRHLRAIGYEAEGAEDAQQALALSKKMRFDLVLTDIHMPGISGLELAKLLLARAPLKPVVVITGDSDETLAREALAQGASGYLLKPFELFELDAVVDQVLSRLALVEATQMLARTESHLSGDDTALPAAWLQLADERSGGGRGHGYRVERMVVALLQNLPGELSAEDWMSLELAARSHELGRILGGTPGNIELAARTAQLLRDLSMSDTVVRTVLYMYEHWDGSGGPEHLSATAIPLTSLVLAVADAVDHHAVLQLNLGRAPNEAADTAVDHVISHSGTIFAPGVVRALRESRETIEAIWTLAAAWIHD